MLTEQELQAVNEVAAIIQDRFSQNISVTDLAFEVGISKTQLNKIFPEVHTLAVHSYLTKIRMEEAAKLLTSRRRKIAYIAKLVGYPHQGTFYEAFKKYYNCTPAQYRKLNR